MATTIKLKNSVTAAGTPSTLAQGEVAINVTDKKMWVGNAATTPVQLLGAGSDGNFTNLTVVNDASISGLTVGKGTGSATAMTVLGAGAGNSTNTGGYGTFVGYQSGYTNTSGQNCSFIGVQSGYFNTTGSYNTALGAGAYASNSTTATGSNNTAVGGQALYSNTTASNNTAVGYQAGYVSTGASNTYLGYRTGYTQTSGTLNTLIGHNSGNGVSGANSYNVGVGAFTFSNLSTGSQNTAMGYGALFSNTTTDNNTAVGYSAGYSNTTGGIEAFGYQALDGNTTGFANVAMGNQAMRYNTTGGYNTAIGREALKANTTASQNTAVGYLAAALNQTGQNITSIGWQAGYNVTGNDNIFIGSAAGAYSTPLTSGSQNIYIGPYSIPSSATVTYETAIGYNVTGKGTNTFTFGRAGSQVWNTFTSNNAWTQSSDARLKTNVQDYNLGLDFITKLRPVTYQWLPSNEIPQELTDHHSEKNQKDTEVVMEGFLAQEVKAALDDLGVTQYSGWSEGRDGSQAISREMLIIPLINAVKELNAKITALENK
jgi:hypothetical protein